ncbi:50S ribosomal protein L25/general stress protein Ctc [Marinospirillum alkaliphilum]|uniref:Large ribosomal subunit protein bL25 n=1 Tax=Marinospirillum alkaliphilum DSM 21637 TaxID=1122209 RepID=A0A1K1YY03_9GAMM|nr:50S ribosomal protein L25/general stress protein Ctc [Marinospirillum alkaliphilum]SFX66687.1 LSU ribosomal protein L25P [Marinospirillum alkaliphilum DSM 21637]
MTQFTFEATVRNDLGKGASRRLRRENKYIPAIVYGGEAAPLSIALEQREFYRVLELEEAIYTSILNLNIDGKAQQVIMKDMQRHPFKPVVMHIDFQRVDSTHKVSVHVPLHFLNEEACVGVKQQGGQIQHLLNDIEVSALPQDLPQSIDIDLSNLEVGQTIHLSDLKLPKGASIVALEHGGDTGVVSVHAKKGGDSAEETAE